MTDTAYLKWFHAVGMYTLAEWSLVPQECGVPWRDWYDVGDTPAQAFARAQAEQAVKATKELRMTARVRMFRDVVIVLGIGVGVAIILGVVNAVLGNLYWLRVWLDDLWAGRL